MPLTGQLGGVRLRAGSDVVESARSVLLRYALVTRTDAEYRRARQWEQALLQYLLAFDTDATVPVVGVMQTWPYLMDEVRENTFQILRMVPCTISLVVIFTIITCSTLDPQTTCCLHAIAAVSNVLMSFGSAFGLVLWAGVPYSDLMALTAFLALAVGVDEAFIMVNAWRNYVSHIFVQTQFQTDAHRQP